VDAQTPGWLGGIAVDPELFPANQELYRSQIKQVTHNDRDARLGELNRRISQLRGEELRLGRLFISGKLSEEAYDRLRLEWREKLRHAQADLADLERDTAMYLDDLDVALVLLSGLSRLYDRLEEKERHTLLQIIAKRAIIGTDGEIIDHELYSPFAYLRNMVDDFSNADNEQCGSGQIRCGVLYSLLQVWPWFRHNAQQAL
jgi:hypothetical protein